MKPHCLLAVHTRERNFHENFSLLLEEEGGGAKFRFTDSIFTII